MCVGVCCPLCFPLTLRSHELSMKVMSNPTRERFEIAAILSRCNSGRDSYNSEKLKKAVAVSEEKIQERSRRRGRFSSCHFPCRKNAQTLAGIASRAAGKLVNNFPGASKFTRKLFQLRISDSHNLLEFSEQLFSTHLDAIPVAISPAPWDFKSRDLSTVCKQVHCKDKWVHKGGV